MKKIYFIGTLHGRTPKNDLESMLNKLNPDQLILEIQQTDIENKNLNSYPDEMVFGHNWAEKNNVSIYGMDTAFSEIADDKDEEDNQKVIALQDKIITNHDWKDFNKEEYLKLLEIPEEKELIDEEKSNLREQEMLKNMLSNAILKGTIVVLTGAGHLAFFEKELPEAIFPLR